MFVAKGGAAALALLFHVVVARALGVDNSGVFFLGYTLITIIAVVGRLGLDNIILRRTAIDQEGNPPRVVDGIFVTAMKRALLASTVLTVAIIVAVSSMGSTINTHIPGLRLAVLILAFAIVPFNLAALHAECLKGGARFLHSEFVRAILPLSLGTLTVVALILPGRASTVTVSLAFVVSWGVSAWIARWMNRRMLGGVGTEAPPSAAIADLSGGRPLLLVGILNQLMVWGPTLALGVWSTPSEVAQFSTASRSALLISFLLVVVNAVVAPRFARLHAENDIQGLRSVAQRLSAVLALIAIPIGVAVVYFAQCVMSVFGPDFITGASGLRILALGQVFNVATGSVGYLLMMTGHFREMRNAAIAGASACSICTLVMTPVWQIEGAASAAAIGVAVLNLVALGYVRRVLGFWNVPTGAEYVAR